MTLASRFKKIRAPFETFGLLLLDVAKPDLASRWAGQLRRSARSQRTSSPRIRGLGRAVAYGRQGRRVGDAHAKDEEAVVWLGCMGGVRM